MQRYNIEKQTQRQRRRNRHRDINRGTETKQNLGREIQEETDEENRTKIQGERNRLIYKGLSFTLFY